MVIANTRNYGFGAPIGIEESFTSLVESFVDRSLPPLRPDWPEIASSLPGGISPGSDDSQQHGRRLGFDDTYLFLAFGWLYREANHKGVDRLFLIDTVDRLSRIVTERLTREAEKVRKLHDRVHGGPYDSDRAAARLSAVFIANESDKSTRRRMWNPWLRLPPPCDHWGEMFLESFYSESLDRSGSAPHFLAAISEMFEFELSPEGLPGRSAATFGSGELACALLGCGRMTRILDRWTEERETMALALHHHWKRWVEVAITYYGCAARFLELLASPAAKQVRVQALSWLAASNIMKWARDDDVHSLLVGLLECIWDDYRSTLGQSPGGREAFDILLKPLLDVQNPRAILLSGQLTTGFTK